ncbi:alkylation response protein AidB-like acyl-CoA dehydrogenase [Saccharopolyspora lacisalsi]|uniref:Alkylation response protein AidB-like acyl-CoA dehydrogenase n=1 Tax=Halosaccharopolyspora lacisalsi TaxID=1000566 RepID=A0A839E007_9PSEU|nr:acyl-CoA dehydrogenase family protein [Halosaccharopolyspora lacisalsi]MBA8826613.1 alkylation response protein AidB-like acyl-CoA dehydrogenase [Halosaccharopolyspora lacisalsi]
MPESSETATYSPTQLPEHLEELRREVREFVDAHVRPSVVDNDRATASEFDWKLVRAGHDRGLFRLVIPKEYGGAGYGVLGVAVALEEIAAACAGTALIFGATMLGQAPVLLSGDPQLQSRFLPMFSGDDPVLACNAVTEELAGCDLLIPENVVHATDVVTARRESDHYVLNGRKRFITNAEVADFGCVYANIEGAPGATGLTAFLVPLGTPGVERGPVADKMGYRACLGSELVFRDVRVPAENMVGGENNGMIISTQQMNMARATVAAISTGVARGAFELAKDWCGQRTQGGAPLYRHQFSARKLAEMTSKIDAARMLYLNAASVADNEVPAPAYEPASAKLFADRVAIDVAEEAMSLMGARGYLLDQGLEKFVRDSLGARIYEGTPEVLALAITEALYADEEDF